MSDVLMSSLRQRLRELRARAARSYVRRRLREPRLTIISDDCWGGRAYAEYDLKCLSPFAGMGFTPREYLNFLTHMREPDALKPLGMSVHATGYPIIETRYAKVFGMHYRTGDEMLQRYERRCRLINWDKLRIKIDLGRHKYQWDDVERWNQLALPNSVAIFPDKPEYHRAKIHHGVCVPNHTEDGAQMFLRSCQRFDVIGWLNDGIPRQAYTTGIMHKLLLEHGWLKKNER